MSKDRARRLDGPLPSMRDERSMRIAELAIALIAVVAAVVLGSR